jgi:uncharacterized surface protein with fasciclin (FAS1) repeats
MVSYAPNVQYLNFQHMFDFTDYRSKNKPELCLTEGSIYCFLSKNPEFSKFKSIIDKANLAGFFNDSQINITLFVPHNNFLSDFPDDFFKTLDIGTARHILDASSIPKRLKKDLLTSSPVCYFYTKNPAMRMYVTNINNITRINNCARIVQYDLEMNNGIIQIIDNLLIPNEDHFLN